MFLEKLEDTPFMLQGHVPLGNSVFILLEGPGRRIIGSLCGIVTREESVIETIPRVHDKGGIGVILNVEFVVEIIIQDVLDHPAQKGDIAFRNGVGQRYRPWSKYG